MVLSAAPGTSGPRTQPKRKGGEGMSEPVVAQKAPYAEEIERGKRYAWCRCGLSGKQPYCDGSHNATEFTPVILEAEESKTVFFCGCKRTGNEPYCDGTHNSL